MGPLEFLVIGFEDNHFNCDLMPELNRLRDKGVIRILDLIVVSRDGAGQLSSLEVSDLQTEEFQELAKFHRELEPWFGQDDIDRIGRTLALESTVAVILLEHLWVDALQEAARKARGRILTGGIIPPEVASEVEKTLLKTSM